MSRKTRLGERDISAEARRLATLLKAALGSGGLIQGHGDVAGFMYWEYDGLDGTAQTVIADGDDDVKTRLQGEAIAVNSGGDYEVAAIDLEPGYSQDIDVATASDTVTLYCNANGSVTIQRTAGSETYKVALRLFWI